jgi:hypothetical protein
MLIFPFWTAEQHYITKSKYDNNKKDCLKMDRGRRRGESHLKFPEDPSSNTKRQLTLTDEVAQ